MELFPTERKYPPGFSYLPEFLTIKEEEFLLQTIARLELHAFNFHGYEAKRRVASFGYDYSFTNRSLTKGLDIPDEFQALIDRVGNELQIAREKIAELLV